MEINQRIENYIGVMRDIRNSINELQGDRFLSNHKKTLLFSLLETMSKGVYGDTRNNYTRFEKFINEFCEWEDGKRISVQQLNLLLEKTEEQDYETLKYYVRDKLSRYPISSPVPFKYDPTLEEIKPFLSEDNNKINDVRVDFLSHMGLLWKFRNTLVHEARGIGAQDLFDEVVVPHYIHYTQLDRDSDGKVIKKRYWQKLYPLQFFNYLVDKAISNIEPYLIQNEINPFEKYSFDPLWIEVRN
ncbi:hypothetical protein [Fictibacillus sp. BK138]|uniref:hypothetical protein n=1 Tax=Fictibacillus sp. BK138 TaxID=2512121 RepID=UPI001029496C|nr:hypothetical protein [Fictibacillus sp. BK138]RZT23128.1 hypothetical protein EV282_2214 [Fictibacillus sp. BK138]